jgi:glycosyltransferase involved in cell wall biosynthesis
VRVRIAYLTGYYPGTTDIWLQREVRALRSLGVDVHTFSVRPTDAATLLSDDQRDEHRRTTRLLPMPLGRVVAAHARWLLRHPGRYLRTAKLARATHGPGLRPTLLQAAYFAEAGVLARELQRRGIGHLHNHLSDASCTVTMLTAGLAGCTFSFSMHGPSIFYEPEKWRIDEKIRRAEFVACISWFCRSQAAAWVESEHWPKLKIIHCGVDASIIPPTTAQAGNRLLFVGRLTAFKGVPILLQAMQTVREAHPDVHLTVVGDGPDRALLERMSTDLGLDANVSFVGSRAPSDVAELLGATDVFVLPSFAEGVPVVLMEALAAEVPVVTTRIAGVGELVEEGVSGLLVPPSDAGSLAAAIGELLADPARRRSMGAAGRRTVIEHFDSITEARRLLSLFTATDPVAGTDTRPAPVDATR